MLKICLLIVGLSHKLMLHVEVVDNYMQAITGYNQRQLKETKQGLYFSFNKEQLLFFTMRKTDINLIGYFINRSNEITQIVQMASHSKKTYIGYGQFFLEVPVKTETIAFINKVAIGDEIKLESTCIHGFIDINKHI